MKKYLFIMMSTMLIVLSAGCSSDDEDKYLYNTWRLVSYGNESNEVLKEANGFFYQITFNSDGSFIGLIDGIYSGQADRTVVFGTRLDGQYM